MAAAASAASSLIGTRSARIQARFGFGGKKQVPKRAASKTVVPDRPLWFPGAKAPEYLDGSLVGDYGFDPFGLGKPAEYLQFDLDSLDQNLAKNVAGDIIGTRTEVADVKSTPFQPYSEVFGLQRFRECELIHGRWAMLATLGALTVEWLTGVTWQDAGKVELVEGSSYLGQPLPFSITTLIWIEVLVIGYIEFQRNSELDSEKRLYPGGSYFDPLGLAADPEKKATLQLAEIKHARLAMVAFLGFAVQAAATGKGPLNNWATHLSDPLHTTILDTVDGDERTGEEILGAARFRSQQPPQEGFDYHFPLHRAAQDGEFRRPASSFSPNHEFRRRGPDREDSTFTVFELPRHCWDDGSAAAGYGGAYQQRMEAPDFHELHFPVKNLRHVEAGWGRVGHNIAEDADDYHSRASWQDEQTLGDFRRRAQRRPDGGRAAASEFDDRSAAKGGPDCSGRDRRETDAALAEVQGREFSGCWCRDLGAAQSRRREADFLQPFGLLQRSKSIYWSHVRDIFNSDFWAREVAAEVGLVHRSSTTEPEDDVAINNVRLFTYRSLRSATRLFHPSNKIGRGGFGVVYKGVLRDGTRVAVKSLSAESKQGVNEFLTEINMISNIQHPNLVRLVGCCVEGTNRILVYEYLENNSLASSLLVSNGKRVGLDWSKRAAICLGTASGLAFLHECAEPCIVHRDIKASNILLDENFLPKIGDFGLAKLFPDNVTHVSTRVAGTVGYLAPEYAKLGQLTKKADVYSFGVLLLEIISGESSSKASFGDDFLVLLEWTWKLYIEGRVLELVDPDLIDYPKDEVTRFIKVSLFCTQAASQRRPDMSQVVRMLSTNVNLNESLLSEPGFYRPQKPRGGASSRLDKTKHLSIRRVGARGMVVSVHRSSLAALWRSEGGLIFGFPVLLPPLVSRWQFPPTVSVG
ncbi:Protein kinase superfamily protein [Striga hermonthica]|uniref:Protein kinase superfamily protein n=1 Tax=Striga hermonthica TaxID=68872 RepID=A0A9N7NUD3_STRHE|nr:Protein kinase superfamily protein [Striga hermonthica]